MSDLKEKLLVWVHLVGSLGTFVYLTFFDGYPYTAWNWIIAVPVNLLLGQIWPLYWLLLRPIFGA